MARSTIYFPIIVLATLTCLYAYGDESQTEETPATDWTLDPDERSVRLARLTQERLTNVSQTVNFSSRFVYEFDQDNQGFIWIGTRNGLDRFDGYSVRNYRRDAGSTNSLSSNDIRTLAAATDGIVWVGSHAGGLDRFDTATGTAINFGKMPGSLRDIGDNHITDIVVSKNGDIWIGTRAAGLSRIDDQSLEVTRYHNSVDSAGQLPGRDINFIFEGVDGRIWVGTDRGLIFSDDISSEFTFVDLEYSGAADSVGIVAMQQSSDRTLYLLTKYGELLKTRLEGKKIGTPSIVNLGSRFTIEEPNSLLMDSNDHLWIASGRTAIYDAVTNSVKKLEAFGYKPFEDRTGTIWFTMDTDVYRLDPDSLAIGYLTVESTLGTDSTFRLPFAVLEAADKSLWVADPSGVRRHSLDSSEVTPFVISEDDDFGRLNDTNALFQDREGVVWAGTYNVGINRINPVNGQIKNYPTCDTQLLNDLCNRVWVIQGDDSDNLWVGTAENFHFFDAKSDSFLPVAVSDETAKTMISSGVRSLEVSGNDAIWIGTQSGLLNWRRSTDVWSSLVHDPAVHGGLRSSYINALHEDASGVLWIGTQLGAHRLDPQNGQIKQFSTATGLPNDDIHSLVEDVYGTIWMSTGEGLVSLDRETYKIRVLNKNNVLAGDEFLLGSGHAGKSGNVYFGGVGSVVYFDPGKLQSNNVSPQVVLTELRINNEIVVPNPADSGAILESPINMSSAIVLPYQRASLAVEFAGIHFARPEQNRYAYRLEGYDDDWIYTDSSRRIASYTNLPFGDYTLRVKASNSDGVWNDVGASLGVTVLTPFWRSLWAYVLYIVATIAIMRLVIQLRTRVLTMRAAILEGMVEERTRKIHENEQLIQSQADDLSKLLGLKERLFTNISHEFRTPLTLILGPVNRLLQSGLTDKQSSHLRLVKQNGQRLLRLVDRLLDLSRLDAEGPIELTLQPISQTATVIVNSFDPLSRSREITFEVNIGDDLWVSASADALETILMNLLSNSFKYTPRGGDISISLTSRNEQVVLEISDSGVGIPLSRQESIFERFNRADDTGENVPGAGIGLALVKETVEALDGAINLTSKPDEGTTISVALRRHTRPDTQSQSLQQIVLSESSNAELESLTQSEYVTNQPADDQQQPSPSILIVEDNQDMRQYLVELLSPPYSCIVAGDGEAGLRMGLEEMPDLVLCDVMLPIIDGYKVSQELRADDRTSHIPIIMLTARGDHDSRLLGLRQKVDDYMAKPFDDEELLLRIKNILDAREVLRKRIVSQIFNNGGSDAGLGERDRKVVRKLNQIIEEHLLDAKFDIGAMASDMAMSERALQRKLKALTGQTPIQYLRKYRLKRSLDYLREGMTVNLAAESVGFSSPAYFTSRFREEFGESPTNFMARPSN